MNTTRNDIMEAARELFAKRSYEAVSVRDIVSQAGANVAAVSYHFGGKENLYREIVRQDLAALRSWIAEVRDENSTTRDKMEILVEGLLEIMTADNSVILMVFNEGFTVSDRISDILEEHIFETFSMFREIIQSGADEIKIREGDELFTVMSFISMPFYLAVARPVVEKITGREGYSKVFMKRAARHSVRVIFEGIEKEPVKTCV